MKRPGEMKRELARTIPHPLYAGVKQMILDRIHSGEWPPKHRVPSENELVSELGVSKMTANRALRELATEGELVRIQGVGSFVAERKGYSALFEVRNIADEIAERGHAHEASRRGSGPGNGALPKRCRCARTRYRRAGVSLPDRAQRKWRAGADRGPLRQSGGRPRLSCAGFRLAYAQRLSDGRRTRSVARNISSRPQCRSPGSASC